ncbi:unnamed protein product [Victoria cruziana]
MSCFPCFMSDRKTPKRSESWTEGSTSQTHTTESENHGQKASPKKEETNVSNGNIEAQTFTFRELAAATNNFMPECLIGEGGFGRVYRGELEGTGQVVAVKQLDRNGLEGNKEFLVEVFNLSLLHHPNLVNLIGYCADGDQRLLVYEFLPMGSLEDHLLDLEPDQAPLDWNTRMNIAAGAAKGLEYLHDKANPPVIYRDLKSSNILLDEEFNPKLSDYGLAKLGPVGDKPHISSRVMGTYGYCAPEYASTGQLTVKSDIYSFGVVLLELITGRRAVDTTKHADEQNLVTWAQPLFRDQKRIPELADPTMEGKYSASSLKQAVAVAAMCLQEEASTRPYISDVVTALSFLAMPVNESGGIDTPVVHSLPAQEMRRDEEGSRSRQESAGDGVVKWGSSSRGSRSSSDGSEF